MLGIFGKLTGAQKKLGSLFVTLVICSVLWAGFVYFPTASNEGYAPEQPIPFSHRLHAGVHKMDCRYCHVAAEKSASATIPAMNVCMNCHRVVKTDSPYIQKLQKAYEEGRPIQWIRVHELPDHVRFKHYPHVQKGISCETCHGDVASMDRVYQASPLTMGWCLDCHRGRNVPSKVMSVVRPGENHVSGAQDEDLAPSNCFTCHY